VCALPQLGKRSPWCYRSGNVKVADTAARWAGCRRAGFTGFGAGLRGVASTLIVAGRPGPRVTEIGWPTVADKSRVSSLSERSSAGVSRSLPQSARIESSSCSLRVADLENSSGLEKLKRAVEYWR
jgi:hypothetical protein